MGVQPSFSEGIASVHEKGRVKTVRMAGRTKAIVLNGKDNVATALEPLKAGSVVFVAFHGHTERIKLASNIPLGHKFSLEELRQGATVVKYGEPIGLTISKVDRGEHVHIHNVISPPGEA
ncbi:MAG: UxaA family hydrolase [Syntrophorhabdaceae bacterium]|nr:UxaA family hydrolase [Syntrophorhabdaceae bacterium]MDD5243339.1 UxaA family hydrolase [Syntrophorhabdaceae bacterium]